jgi:hypothetical protein
MFFQTSDCERHPLRDESFSVQKRKVTRRIPTYREGGLTSFLCLLLLIGFLYWIWKRNQYNRNPMNDFVPLTTPNRERLMDAANNLVDYTAEQTKVLQLANQPESGWMKKRKTSSSSPVFVFPANPDMGVTRSWTISYNSSTKQWQIVDPVYNYGRQGASWGNRGGYYHTGNNYGYHFEGPEGKQYAGVYHTGDTNAIWNGNPYDYSRSGFHGWSW